ncbi:hypothetical protein PR048_012566 [Dryococelus australis]|uniref:Retrotransposon gag domain-containing protein n=1 Tax=Dryococelus australis TaxID=614101 RepID=A0ABQ9HQ05_9NEOP|nr:hypothetical protein PR048_012566 [Dryococelus australis]
MPRVAALQTMRPNLPGENVEEYFSLLQLHPTQLVSLNKNDFESLVNTIQEVYHIHNFEAELSTWYKMWVNRKHQGDIKDYVSLFHAKDQNLASVDDVKQLIVRVDYMLSVHREKLQMQKSKVKFIEKVIDRFGQSPAR